MNSLISSIGRKDLVKRLAKTWISRQMDIISIRIVGENRPKGLPTILRQAYGFVKDTMDQNLSNNICKSYKLVNQTKLNALAKEVDFRTSIALKMRNQKSFCFTEFVALIVVTTIWLFPLLYDDKQQVPWNELDLPDFTTIERVYLLVCNFGRFFSHENKFKTCSYYHASSFWRRCRGFVFFSCFNHYKRKRKCIW